MSRIFRALQQLERDGEKEAQPGPARVLENAPGEGAVTIPYPGPKDEAAVSPEGNRLWRPDGPHGEKPISAGPYLDRKITPRQGTGAGLPHADRLRAFHGLYRELLRDVLEALILNAAWKYQDRGCIITHLMDVAVDPAWLAALAAGLAEKRSAPILLVDADLQAARLTQRLGNFGPRPFHEVLRIGAPIEAELPTSWMNLKFLPGRRLTAPLPAWVECTRLFDDFRSRYLMTLVLYPLQIDEFLPRLLRASDDVWLWCSARHTPRNILSSVVEQTRGLSRELSGVVLVTAEQAATPSGDWKRP